MDQNEGRLVDLAADGSMRKAKVRIKLLGVKSQPARLVTTSEELAVGISDCCGVQGVKCGIRGLVQAHRDGASTGELAKRHGVAKSAVLECGVFRAGISPSPRPTSFVLSGSISRVIR
ncbi:hypothetical protein D5S18_30145 [Nocardia panacis]|uniref:Uncharacterized protein n=1 Tax=Nocardia panacis TaxID=2340916 RepID=A0A3A4KCR8_9NOCA|nr:hypothetical protein [Nocardia panacis]RJO70112.1 hypothetical protein D5S18_30145 [Nocardia panacis]